MPTTIAVDQAVAAELRDGLAALDGLWDRYESATRRYIESGGLAELDPDVPDGRFVFIHGSQALATALDHLAAWRLLVEGGTFPIQAQMTLLRAALEACLRARWLLDGLVGASVRVARGYAAKLDDFRERRRWEGAPRSPYDDDERPRRRPTWRAASQRLDDLDRQRRRAGVPVEAYADATSLARAYGLERWFRRASAAAHGKEWVLGDAQIDERGDAGPGVRQGLVSANDRLLLQLTSITLEILGEAIADLEAL